MAVHAVIYQQFMGRLLSPYNCIPLEYSYKNPIPGYGYKLIPGYVQLLSMLADKHHQLEDLIRKTNKMDTLVFILVKAQGQVEDFEKFLSTRPWVEATCHTKKGVTNDVHPEKPNNMFLYTVKGAKE